MPRPKGDFDQKAYLNQYEKENIIQKKVQFNRRNPDDMALLEWATMHESFTRYIKSLIHADMNLKDLFREDEEKPEEEPTKEPEKETVPKVCTITFPGIDGYRDEEAIKDCMENEHGVYCGRYDFWEVRIDMNTKKVLAVDDIRKHLNN